MIDIKEKYALEIQEIKDIFNKLEKGHIYLPGVYTSDRSNGSIEHNITDLKQKLNILFNKIEKNLDSDSDKLNDIFK
ncbi:hypothetical protein [Lysinibacillus sp. fls2-241-R2A-57]|uniref:hypothetical protein n=1 Tax=Lysinibacillus sp. fls2-241-R2A-57 TaxID=3040292 RepID=UPI002555913B|nr:hypothetical protein [Lysinibacillus sp. fls2-241-R2A-57]